MSCILLADIGGSTSRFAYATSGGRPTHIVTLANDSLSGIEAGITHYLDATDVRPAAAVFAVAGPIRGDQIALTNRAWQFRPGDLSARFGFSDIRIVNDFEALAWALPRFQDGDFRSLGAASACARGVKVVLGPGTGLGVAALVPTEVGWHVVSSEGGHASFGPTSREEDVVFRRLRAGCSVIEAETILSGPGIVRLHSALNPGTLPLTPNALVTSAHAGESLTCATVRMFVRLLGRFAGDVALTFKATGGVYIAGGVAFGLASLLDDAAFRDAFEAHPQYKAFLATTPTFLITCAEPGLIGCAALAEWMIAQAR